MPSKRLYHTKMLSPESTSNYEGFRQHKDNQA